MFLTFEETSELIRQGKVLHIAGTEQLLRKLPKGNWVGGSTEYFMTKEGGVVSDERLMVAEFPFYTFDVFEIKAYGIETISDIAKNTSEEGFSLVLIPAETPVHAEYAQYAQFYEDMFVKSVVGWITGANPAKAGQIPIAVNGKSGEVFTDKAVVLGVSTKRSVDINIVNIFETDPNSPVITFTEFLNNGFSVEKCLINGEEVIFADYLIQNKIDTHVPLIGQYSGAELNTSFWGIKDGKVNFAGPLFDYIEYRLAKPLLDYEKAFNEKLAQIADVKPLFCCNCIGNFWYGNLEGKMKDSVTAAFTGPITFGEIAYQVVNQTLVYITVK